MLYMLQDMMNVQGRLDFCDANAENGLAAVHRGIHAVVHLIEDHAAKAKFL